MATAGIVISADFPALKSVGESIRRLGDKKFAAVALKDALEKAILPAFMRLKELTPIGPTGNLRAAAAYIAKAYPKNGGAVALIGYRRSGQKASESAQGGKVRVSKSKLGDRAYHQWMIEFGTAGRAIKKPVTLKKYKRVSPVVPFVRVRRGKQEVVRGRGVEHDVNPPQGTYYIASSYNSLGPFGFEKNASGGVQTNPQYPNAFFMKSKSQIVLPPVKPGGVGGVPPLRTAFQQTQSRVAFILQQELRITLERALSAMVFRDQGTISGV